MLGAIVAFSPSLPRNYFITSGWDTSGWDTIQPGLEKWSPGRLNEHMATGDQPFINTTGALLPCCLPERESAQCAGRVSGLCAADGRTGKETPGPK
jgi:hypothetical protein